VVDLRHTSVDVYISDTWAATPKLSVNIGLRYELNTPVNEHWGRASLFNFTAPGGFQTLSPGQQLFASHLDTFAPRLGIAYRLTHRDVIRAGFGIFLDNSPQLNNTFEATNPPFLVIESFTSSKTNPLLLSNPFPTGSLVVGGVPSPSMGQYTAGIPTVNDWTVDFQHSFARNLLLDVGYVGNRASHFGRTMTANVPLVPGPSAIQARRPLPGFGPVRYFQFDDYSTYEALQARLEKRFSNGVSLLVSYTWSKTLDLSSEELAGGTIDPNNLDRDYGPADFNQPQNLAISYVYRLPVGKGNRFLPSMNWVGQEILGGWAVSGITRYQTGFPLTIAALGDVANEGLGTRPDRVCNGNLGGNATSAEWFNTSCFVNPAKYTFGNSGRGVLTDPGNKEWDIGMMKQFPTFKEQHLEFRLDMFNAFNIVNLSGPGATVGAAGFGEILSAGAGRTLQFALKYYF
jgi:hypothetical protein